MLLIEKVKYALVIRTVGITELHIKLHFAVLAHYLSSLATIHVSKSMENFSHHLWVFGGRCMVGNKQLVRIICF